MPKTKLSCHDRSDHVPSVIKTRQDNDMSDHTFVVEGEKYVELSRLIELSVDNDEN